MNLLQREKYKFKQKLRGQPAVFVLLKIIYVEIQQPA
jgi:hypothetical protein